MYFLRLLLERKYPTGVLDNDWRQVDPFTVFKFLRRDGALSVLVAEGPLDHNAGQSHLRMEQVCIKRVSGVELQDHKAVE